MKRLPHILLNAATALSVSGAAVVIAWWWEGPPTAFVPVSAVAGGKAYFAFLDKYPNEWPVEPEYGLPITENLRIPFALLAVMFAALPTALRRAGAKNAGNVWVIYRLTKPCAARKPSGRRVALEPPTPP